MGCAAQTGRDHVREVLRKTHSRGTVAFANAPARQAMQARREHVAISPLTRSTTTELVLGLAMRLPSSMWSCAP